MTPEQIHIAGIETLSIGDIAADTAVVFLHGYGANMSDLFPLWELWHRPNFRWYFPNGLQSLPMGYYEGRAWFQIDMASLEKSMREGTHRDMAASIPAGFDDTVKHLEIFLTDLKTRHKKIILGGFSQGAMCASHLGTKNDLYIEALILLSGNIVAESRFPDQAKGLPFYQSHGLQDPILSVNGAKALEEKLQSLNYQGKLHTFTGGHEIPVKVINEVKIFLNSFS